MIWLEEKYINLLSNRLQLFKKVKQNLYAFRCNICGDSKKHTHKTRGGFYLPPHSDTYNMGCFNCSASMKFVNFLKLTDPLLFNEYIVEYYQAKNDANVSTSNVQMLSGSGSSPGKKQPRIRLSDLECISDLPEDHPAVNYLRRRKVDEQHWDRLYFVLRFRQWEANFRQQKVDSRLAEHPRLIIPFFDTQGNIFRISARAFGKQDPKYLYMKVTDDASRVYGLDTVNPSLRVYVFEGPIDSLFIENGIAVGSASLIVPELKEYKDFVLVPDNQPRNPEVCGQIKKMVDSGNKVCLWNTFWGKDVNDMVMAGRPVTEIKRLIDESTYSGIQAKIKFASWVKCQL